MKYTREEKSWILYDVANSAFSMIISTTIPIYFTILAASNDIDSEIVSGYWGSATSISVLILAILSPILGTFADYKGMKKKMFAVSFAVGVTGLVILTLTDNIFLFMGLFIIARLGYSACNVFYDSMLIDVTDDARMDEVSSNGYAWGYIGSCVPFIASVLVIYFSGALDIGEAQAYKITFLITAFWWIVMSIPLFKNVKHQYYLETQKAKTLDAFRRLGKTMKKISANKKMLFFIVAYFCYIDGVYTIISMATVYGAEVGIGRTMMIGALLLTQFVAFPCAILSGKLGKKYGPLKMIRIFIIIYFFTCIFGYQLDKAWEFWVLAVIVGLAQGGIQSLSRSYYAKIIPKNESNEYFGFFDIFGKFADFFGPLLISLSAFIFKSSKFGILSLAVLFVIGFVLIGKVQKYDTIEE